MKGSQHHQRKKKFSLSDKRASFGGVGFGHSQKVLLCVYDMKNGKCDQYFEAKINFTTRTLAWFPFSFFLFFGTHRHHPPPSSSSLISSLFHFNSTRCDDNGGNTLSEQFTRHIGNREKKLSSSNDTTMK